MNLKKLAHGIAVNYSKFRVWGITGVVSFFVREMTFRRLRREFWKLSKASTVREPVRGITVIGDLTGRVALNKTLRDFVSFLKDAGIPYQTYDTMSKSSIPARDVAGLLTPSQEFDLRKYSHIVVMYRSALLPEMVSGCQLARIVFHDSEHGIHEMMPYIRDSGDAVIALSDFNYRYFVRAFDHQKVYKITYPLLLPDSSNAMPRNELRKKYGISSDDFVAFFNFDFGSYYRKNVTAAIRAFAKAFGNLPRAKLMFKTKGAKVGSKELREVESLISEFGLVDRFVHISSYLPRAEIDGLTGASDVYLSLHKSEGFGIGMAEAMSQAKPVVATNWSANTEFCTPETAWCVPYRMTPILAHEYPVEMKEWADADVDAAAKMLREIYDNPTVAAERAKHGQVFIREHYSVEHFKRDVEKFLDDAYNM